MDSTEKAESFSALQIIKGQAVDATFPSTQFAENTAIC